MDCGIRGLAASLLCGRCRLFFCFEQPLGFRYDLPMAKEDVDKLAKLVRESAALIARVQVLQKEIDEHLSRVVHATTDQPPEFPAESDNSE